MDRLMTLLIVIAMSALAGCGDDAYHVDLPPDFPPLPVPAGSELTTPRVSLGKRLFYDKQLSRTEEVSCGSCHMADHAFADSKPLSIGVDGQHGKRNAPGLVNVAYGKSFFWDGGVPTLEQQAIGPITNPLEMDMKLEDVVARVSQDSSYVAAFEEAWSEAPTPGGVTRSIAAFERTIVGGDSRYDRYQRGDLGALSDSEKRGMDIAMGERGSCFHCHLEFNLTNDQFRNDNLYAKYDDIGRAKVTGQAADVGKFKVPTLRNVAVTAPYMHDGSLATLEDVVEHYSSGGVMNDNSDPLIQPLDLTAGEKADLVAFLGALTDESLISDPRFRP
jgi:cytochrome c peroxidase